MAVQEKMENMTAHLVESAVFDVACDDAHPSMLLRLERSNRALENLRFALEADEGAQAAEDAARAVPLVSA